MLTLQGGTSIDAKISSGGILYARSGTVTDATAYAGGQVVVYEGGTAVGTIVEGSGSVKGVESIASGGIGSDTTLDYGGVLNVAGTETTTYVNSGAVINVYTAGTVTGSIISGGGTVVVSSGGLISGTTEILSGGSLTMAATAGAGIIDFVGTGGVLVVSGASATTTITNSISGFTSGDTIDFANIGYTGSSLTGNGTETVSGITITEAAGVLTVTSGGTTDKIDIVGLTSASAYTLSDDNGTLAFVTCYLDGTLIEMADGSEVAVEDIRIGDSVATLKDGAETAQAVTWVGRKHQVVAQGLPEDIAGYPVRILKGALAENVPHKDLLVTPEHNLYLNGGFTPARMLVNGRSIFYDRSLTSYDYFHIETERHSILRADGALSESYLDTGNRRSFTQHGQVSTLLGRTATWENDAAAPLFVSREQVEPIFRRLEQRAVAQHAAVVTQPVQTTMDHDLHRVTDKGHVVRQTRVMNDQVMFLLPSGVQPVRLVSRTARPADVIGPFVDDRRELGVLIGNITLWHADVTREIDTHLADEPLAGWSGVAAASCRWTLGDAWLSLGEQRKAASIGMLSLQILAAGPYIVGNADVAAGHARTA